MYSIDRGVERYQLGKETVKTIEHKKRKSPERSIPARVFNELKIKRNIILKVNLKYNKKI